jgi:hypothetical protein
VNHVQYLSSEIDTPEGVWGKHISGGDLFEIQDKQLTANLFLTANPMNETPELLLPQFERAGVKCFRCLV